MAVARPRGRRLIYAAGGLLAAAASVVLLITAWRSQSFDTDIAAFGIAAYNVSGSPLRGDGGKSPAAPEDRPEWLLAVLNDPAVEEALGESHRPHARRRFLARMPAGICARACKGVGVLVQC